MLLRCRWHKVYGASRWCAYINSPYAVPDKTMPGYRVTTSFSHEMASDSLLPSNIWFLCQSKLYNCIKWLGNIQLSFFPMCVAVVYICCSSSLRSGNVTFFRLFPCLTNSITTSKIYIANFCSQASKYHTVYEQIVYAPSTWRMVGKNVPGAIGIYDEEYIHIRTVVQTIRPKVPTLWGCHIMMWTVVSQRSQPQLWYSSHRRLNPVAYVVRVQTDAAAYVMIEKSSSQRQSHRSFFYYIMSELLNSFRNAICCNLHFRPLDFNKTLHLVQVNISLLCPKYGKSCKKPTTKRPILSFKKRDIFVK